MTYIEHDRDCKIFKDKALAYDNGVCNCSARYARSPQIMGPHENGCIYSEKAPASVHHGICYCGASPTHDQTCREETCPFWARRSGVKRVVLGKTQNEGVLIIPSDMVA